VLTPEQTAAIREKAVEHARKNVGLLRSKFPGILISPTEGRLVKLSIPTPDGTYLTVQRGEDMLFEDRLTAEFATASERPWNEAQARVVRHQALVDFLTSEA